MRRRILLAATLLSLLAAPIARAATVTEEQHYTGGAGSGVAVIAGSWPKTSCPGDPVYVQYAMVCFDVPAPASSVRLTIDDRVVDAPLSGEYWFEGSPAWPGGTFCGGASLVVPHTGNMLFVSIGPATGYPDATAIVDACGTMTPGVAGKVTAVFD